MICPSNTAPLTLGRILTAGVTYLLRHGVDAREAQTQGEILLSEYLHLAPLSLALHADNIPDEATVQKLREAFTRLGQGEPIQYLIGHWPFHNIELKVDARALIPRPETEELVERVLASPHWKTARTIVDIGTGTGAILLSLAQAARGTPRTFTGIDLSAQALALATENAVLNHLPEVTFIQGSCCAMLPPNSVDIIVSNPPYITTRDVDALPDLILKHEPRMALDGGQDGLDILRQIVLDATQVLRPNGRLFFEMGDEQGLAMRRILECSGYTDVVIAKDLAGHDRYAEGTLR